VHDAVDEQGGGAPDLARRDPAVHVPPHTPQYAVPGPVAVEQCDVQPEVAGIPAQVVVVERPLVVKQLAANLGGGQATQKPAGCRMRTTWMRPGCSWWISRTFPT
jgi:hypothetical protein